MRNLKTIQRIRDEVVVKSITCDLCGRTYRGEHWECYDYEVLETEVRLRTGTSYPEGGSGDEVYFDICPPCFTDKLIPALRALGAEPTETEWDW